MNSEEFKSIIENARISKGISQRELSKLSGISRSTLNDMINGKIKKLDVDALKNLAETLDLSLEKLLKVAGYNEFLGYFTADKYKTRSTTDLKNEIETYKKSELSLLEFDSQKRKKAIKAGEYLFKVKEDLNKLSDKEDEEVKKYIKEALEELEVVSELLNPIKEKYDYSKLPN